MWLLIPILFYTLVFLSVRHVYSYWLRKGFPHENSNLTWTFLKQVYKREFYYVDAMCEAYRADLSLARHIMENACGYFNDSKWDYVRGYRKFNIMEKICPVFNAARLEAVFRIIEKVGDNAVNHLGATAISSHHNSSAETDMEQIFRTYSMSIIANLIYGLEIDLFKQKDSVFHQYLNYSIRPSAVYSYTFNRMPKKSSLTYRLRDVIRENIERREEGGMIRRDILQVLVKFRNGNDIDQKEKLNWHIENLFDREKLLSINKLAHIAEHLMENGLGTVSSTAAFALYEILQQPELKSKILDEIQNNLKNKQPQLTYEGLQQLKLMDLCIYETVRKYPSVAVIERICRKDFQIPNSKNILTEGKSFVIPLLAIQRDEKYFDDPLSFKPQRFLHDNNGSKTNCLISFGLGAKTCIAQNFVKLVVKCILVKLFLKFHMEPVQPENVEIRYNRTPFIQSKEGFRVKLKPRRIN